MQDNKSNKFSIKRRFKSFLYAFRGILLCIQKEHNAWIHLAATILVISLGIIYSLSKTEWCAIIIVMGMVWSAEIFNTAIERIADDLSQRNDEQAGKVKDIAAGAVLITAIVAVLVGFIIFLPKFA